ncbi:dTDP-4-dehydrorhamnose 3,5-epimerase [Hydromonas duriensis]|uniref:dTDP-4-dehydrorhamnose 3,5-epimerase n=2 Tax=Hydromonas duriensis TaxID=1527608 RepID=A0A4R6YC60_9BURK|nr:dTDP-4-dehydrorhamnose 3,5-epimerase [Hydromonas duriensis]TDR33158.1 dTDP-4-dehydrorhamnose 3,5-epimerase [Hydromonas duriensis]
MNVIDTAIPEVKIIEPTVFGDARGFFFESFNEQQFRKQTGVTLPFVQDNHSRSTQGVLRGLHYQIERAQGKLVRVVNGTVIDVAVDLRQSSPTFKQWVAVELSADNHRQLWIPPGFGHGFVVTSESADFLYKTTDYWFKAHERSIRWDDPELAINWGVTPSMVLLADKDKQALFLNEAELFE